MSHTVTPSKRVKPPRREFSETIGPHVSLAIVQIQMPAYNFLLQHSAMLRRRPRLPSTCLCQREVLQTLIPIRRLATSSDAAPQLRNESDRFSTG